MMLGPSACTPWMLSEYGCWARLRGQYAWRNSPCEQLCAAVQATEQFGGGRAVDHFYGDGRRRQDFLPSGDIAEWASAGHAFCSVELGREQLVAFDPSTDFRYANQRCGRSIVWWRHDAGRLLGQAISRDGCCVGRRVRGNDFFTLDILSVRNWFLNTPPTRWVLMTSSGGSG